MLRRNKVEQIQQADMGARSAARTDAVARPGEVGTGLARRGEAQQRDGAASGSSPAPREPFTYVHRGTTVIGQIVAKGRVRVHGEVRGDVKVDGVLEVAESGTIVGSSIEAREVKVLGKVTADVVATGKVEIWKGGVLTGDVSAPVLDIEEGATFNGFSRMAVSGSGTDDGSEDGSDSAPGLELEREPGRLAAAEPAESVEALESAE